MLVSTAAIPTTHATSGAECLCDELAALLPPGWSLDFPLARIRTCGTLAVEVLTDRHPGPDGRLQAVYGPPVASLFKIKGMTTAFLLLALLASQPGGFAAKDFLTQTLPHLRPVNMVNEEEDLEDEGSFTRLDNVISLLRKLLYPPKLLAFSGANKLRKHLVRFVRATPDSGPGYQLAAFPLLWLDAEAMERYVTCARRLEEHGEDGLEEWQAAYQIGMRGPFLGHEPYSDWADWRRVRVTELLWQSVNAQWKRAASWGNGTSGVEVASRLLLEFWQAHITNEDAFRSLVELLGKQERFQQVEECYTQLCATLDRQGRFPHKRTQETMEFVRTAQLQGERHRYLPMLASSSSRSLAAEGTHTGEEGSREASAVFGNEGAAERIVPETRHLIGRETWLTGVCQMVQAFSAKKLIILQGPIGVGKSSELTRLVSYFQHAEHSSSRVIWLPFPAAEWSGGPETALDVLLGTLLRECGIGPFRPEAPRERLIAAFLTHIKQQNHTTVMLLDNAECLLGENGALALCWETFLIQFVRSRHQATIILATKEWHGWPGRESMFVAEIFVPPLTPTESVCLLQRLGLEAVPTELLQAVGAQMAGIPLLLEWAVKLVADPLLLDDWESFNEHEAILQPYTAQESLAERLKRLLNHPSLLGEHLASRLMPLLQHILEKHLSDEARLVLARLAVATVPLGKPALQILCPRPRLLKELRDASLLAAYTNRVQLLPIVAFTVQQQLSPAQRQEAANVVIQAYDHWLDEGHMEMREAGSVVTELAVLLLTRHHLLEAAQLLILFGWCSFNLGYRPRLAHLAQTILHQVDWHDTEEHECSGLVLVQILFPFLGKPIDPKQYVDYLRIWNAIADKKVMLPVATGIYVTHLLLLDATNNNRFEDAQALLNAYSTSLKQKTVLLGEHAFLLGAWSNYAEEQGDKQQAQHLREQTIDLYRQLTLLLSSQEEVKPLDEGIRKKRLASYLNSLAYHLNIMGRYEEALQMVEQSIPLKEQGYVYVGALAASYGEKAEILMELGRFQEALVFDEKAMMEIQRCADAGDALSMRELSTYQVIRGRLYLRLGKVDEAERLLQVALSHIHPKRRMYRMFAQDGLNEIEQWRQQSVSPQHQLDWRWVERYRELCAYDSRWWLTWAGPFTEEEQTQWDQLFALPLDDVTKMQLGTLMKVSRERELEAAIAEQREPRLQYPAIAIEEIHQRIAAQLALQEEIHQKEPNTIVRRLYQGAIEEEIDYLRLIEATYEGNTERFWEYCRHLLPLPTKADMEYAFARVKHVVRQGLENPKTADVSQQLQKFVHTHLRLSLDLTPEEETHTERIQSGYTTSHTARSQRTMSAQAAKRFFTTVLHEGGYEDWQVIIDQITMSARVEKGARHVYLPEKCFSLAEIRHLFIHELAGHVARCIAGEQSPLGLLGIQTKNCLPTEEGIVLYYERQATTLRGEMFDDSGLRIGLLAVGLASGVMTPPQTFLSLFTFLECYTLLVRLLTRPEARREELQEQVRQYALSICLRVYRGVPHLEQTGTCYLQDAVHLHGLRLIEHAVAQDETVLDRLAVGKVALEHLPDLQELGIVSAPQPFKKLVFDPDLDSYILSFAQSEEDAETGK